MLCFCKECDDSFFLYSDVDVCEANCQNNGTCVNNGTTDYCVCPEGFGGELCQTGER